MILGMSVRIVSQNRVAAGEAFLDFGLQRVIVIVRIVAKVAESLRPAEFLEVRFALVRAETVGKTDEGWLVEVVVGPLTRKYVGSLVAYVGDLDRHGRGDLTLERGVPCVQSGQPHLLRIYETSDPDGKQRISIRALRLLVKHRIHIQERRSLREVEHALEIIG